MVTSRDPARTVIGVMGEFNAGKSTLCNLLLGMSDLPEMIVPTQLPPVWFTKGPERHEIVMKSGEVVDIDDDFDPEDALATASHLLMHRDIPMLEHIDIVDFPGISDPNMSADVWQRVLPEMDAILWLTHATQAWRQSEAAVWNTVADEIKPRSALVVTQMDKLTSDADKTRILRRLAHDVADDFAQIIPVSLLRAVAAQDDPAALKASGMADLQAFLCGFGKGAETAPDTSATAPCAPEPTHNLIVPRRVKPAGKSSHMRPRPPATTRTAGDAPAVAM
ncbi:MAG: dynamin family protein [Pseudomonadota bacterium]